MINEICNLQACNGCEACYNACAHDAIEMKPDEEGFRRPHVSPDRCVDCGLCVKTCPINNPPAFELPKGVYSGWSADERVRLSSSSGGAFTEIARNVLEQKGVVFGCALDDNLQACHIYVETLEDLAAKLSGSKYVQSRIGDAYRQAKQFLLHGRKVLFSGTSCQIAALRNYLRNDYPNLLTVDLICHGVPSPMVFEDYKKYMAEQQKMVITDIKFRCKKSSWIFFNMTLTGHVEKSSALKIYEGAYFSDPWIRGFLRDYFLRPSCHECRFASTERVSDFTIADWWEYKKESATDKDYRAKGVSLLLVNTEKGTKYLPLVDMKLKVRTIEQAMKTNLCLSCSYPMPDSRNDFWNDYRIMPFADVVSKYMYPQNVSIDMYLGQKMLNTDMNMRIIWIFSFPQRVVRKIVRILKHLIGLSNKTNKQ